MADLVADDGHQFGIVHHVHQAGIHPDGAVAAGEGIDLIGPVHFEVDGNTVDRLDFRHEFPQAGIVGTFVDLVDRVHVGDGLGAELRDLFIGNGQGRHGGIGCRGEGRRIHVGQAAGQDAASGEHQGSDQQGEKSLFHGFQDINLQIYKKSDYSVFR